MQKRLKYIDVIRGITMLLVIYSHLNYKLFGNYPESAINNIFVTFRMPLFFFISGFFMFSSKYDMKTLKRRFVNRYTRQLYPTIIFLGIFVYLISGGVISALSDDYKCGYWFTIVSVEMFTIWGPILYMVAKRHWTKQKISLLLMGSAICSSVVCVIGRKFLFDNIYWTTLSCDPLFHFIPYLLLGFLAKMYYDDITGKLLRLDLLTIAVLFFVFTILKPQFSCFTLVPAVCAIYIIHYILFKLKDRIHDTYFERIFTLIGTSTLEIYLIHYIVILGLSNIGGLILFGKSISNTIWEFPVYIVFSGIIALICIGIVRVLKVVNINKLFFPETKDVEGLILSMNKCWHRVIKPMSRCK